jgi:hypothetical protein
MRKSFFQETDANTHCSASFALVLLTAIPLSLRQIAATNAPAVSSILWEEFLDESRPQWFLNLPYDIQSYLVKEFGPSTAWLPVPPQTTDAQATSTQSEGSSRAQSSQATPSVSASTRSSATRSQPSSFSTSTRSFASSSNSASTVGSSPSKSSYTNSASSSATNDPASPPASNAGLTRNQKIGLGVGVPIGLVGAAALLLGCCFLLRRRKKQVNGSERPSSPGFIPHFAFQDRSTENYEHRAPLNRTFNESSHDLGTMNWEDDGYDPYENTAYDPAPMAMAMGTSHHGYTYTQTSAPAPAPQMAMQDTQPIMAPALFHTHSSNRARGKRTSYSSLHSVAEITEPDENMESPILGRHTTPLQRKRRPSMPMVLEIPRAATIKRKPVPESPIDINPAAEAASASLLRPPMRHVDHSGSSSSGLAMSTNSSTSAVYHQDTAVSPVSPISQMAPTNPFRNEFAYVEDYGPEYQSGYIDHEDGAYGGNTSLGRYPDPSPPRRSSKTEWPLRNMSLGRRKSSPLWDRVYER